MPQSLNRHQMPFEMTRRCVNLGTDGNLLDLPEEVGNERSKLYDGFLKMHLLHKICREMRCFFELFCAILNS